MSEKLITNVMMVQSDGGMLEGNIQVEGYRIAHVQSEPVEGFSGTILNGQGLLALPGFIDIHIHGAVGSDFMDGTKQAYANIANALPREGTTAFLATTMTQSPEAIRTAVDCGKHFMEEQHPEGAEMLGFHLEGPFINKEQAGAQPAGYIRPPSMEMMEQWFGHDLGGLSVVTLAPELDEDFQVTRQLALRNVLVSAGHTNADFITIKEAASHGLSHLTHFGNAMKGLHHREIGTVGAGMLIDDIFCELIADGVHLSEDMIRLMIKTIGPERMILITDSMMAKGMKDGVYTLGGQEVTVQGSRATLKDGTLAGSVLKMNDALKRLHATGTVTMEELVALSSANAAKQLGVYDRKGSLTAGKDADIVLLDEQFNVVATFCRGRMVYINRALDQSERLRGTE
ncbi:N-acetylglucosamine-6-phosphate deacetylase [Sporosarcina sp. NCCP-2222]|uniref:N-acetylglucosamine-6-phosphate deacetylase n=1 Tax=Sporosarcina sp. NCCP-2222 TaxID=2935073 RepID=UPI002083187C|nr:N-acetylglucosamine-6-phosphate deacetylase [Sporosarcina sp. NCCP-2222]GKV56835.1 N-acetylglucosamine-6-phosphate deacetylase [Sporosarcina sp. NCCP-2222]